MLTEKVRQHFNVVAVSRAKWKKKAKYYHDSLEKLYSFLIPKLSRVLEIGCGTGDLLNATSPSYGMGIDIAERMIEIARKKYQRLRFVQMDAQALTIQEKFDYVILSDVIGNLEDIQKSFDELHKVANSNTRIVITYYNTLWEPILNLIERVGLKMPQPPQNWLSQEDIENLLKLANFEVIKKGTLILIPLKIPFISNFINKFIARLPLIKHLCLVQYFIARQMPYLHSNSDYSVSLIIPARNEAGNIERILKEVPNLGTKMEYIFIEGHSKDNTKNEIERIIKKYKEKKDIILIDQKKGIGKADAVRLGFDVAKHEICVVFDADLTVSPADLPKFYQSLRTRKGELVQGSRLVYPMEHQAMKFLNIIGNKLFSIAFSFLLDQPIKDTLCGTKALFRKDYEKIKKNRSYFGDFDPFGDYDLIFGASKLNLKIIEIPIRYKARSYGTTNISRFTHGWLLLRMTLIAAKKLKFV
ncbi:MAG: glycosyltransferase [Candidatus Levybacteria bacterium]|nr:glycosyltransferase [Candidatus Levybacteria bacterium]